MITFNDIESIERLPHDEFRRHILETINKITDGAIYEPNLYGQFAIVEVGDVIEEIEVRTGCQVMHNKLNNSRYGDAGFETTFEWLVEHSSFYEAVYIISDDGFGIDLLIPKAPGIDSELLAMCLKYAVPA